MKIAISWAAPDPTPSASSSWTHIRKLPQFVQVITRRERSHPKAMLTTQTSAVAPDLSARGCVPGLRKSRYADVLARLRLTPIGHDRLPPSATQKFNPQATLVQGRYFETTVGDVDSGAKRNRFKRSGFGHLCKLFDDRLEGRLEGETFSRREIGGFDDVLDSSSDRRSMSM
jgi:hypothetical protein